jgi:hypothetical protein
MHLTQARTAVLASVVVAGVVAACAGFPMPGAVGRPTIVEGVFLDRTGRPVPNAEVTLAVSDWSADLAQVDQGVAIYELRVTTDAGGRFAFTGPPSPEILALVDGGDVVNIDLIGIQPATLDIATWSFPRSLDGSMWVGPAPTAELRVLGP